MSLYSILFVVLCCVLIGVDVLRHLLKKRQTELKPPINYRDNNGENID